MSLMDYNQTLEDLKTILKKNLIANGYNYDVQTVYRRERISDRIHDDQAFMILPGNDTLIESYATSDELREWEVIILSFIEVEDIEIGVENFKQDIMRNLNKEYRSPPEPINEVEVSTVQQSTLMDEFKNASVLMTAKFQYILEREV